MYNSHVEFVNQLYRINETTCSSINRGSNTVKAWWICVFKKVLSVSGLDDSTEGVLILPLLSDGRCRPTDIDIVSPCQCQRMPNKRIAP